jgi:hypothetical protein
MANFHRSFDVHPMLMQSEGIPITVLADGKKLSALLDTGATKSSIDIAQARHLHWDEQGTHQTRGIDSQGTYPRFVGDLVIPLLGETVPAPIDGLPLSRHNFPWAAIIGRDVLCKFAIHIDGINGQVTFTRP